MSPEWIHPLTMGDPWLLPSRTPLISPDKGDMFSLKLSLTTGYLSCAVVGRFSRITPFFLPNPESCPFSCHPCVSPIVILFYVYVCSVTHELRYRLPACFAVAVAVGGAEASSFVRRRIRLHEKGHPRSGVPQSSFEVCVSHAAARGA